MIIDNFKLRPIIKWYLKIPTSLPIANIQNYWTWFTATSIGLIIHFSWIFLFYFMNIYPMAIVNIFSTLSWITSITLLRNGFITSGGIIVIFELILHAVIAVHFVGWDYGFQYYIVVVPVGLYLLPPSSRFRNQLRFIFAFISATGFIFMWFSSREIVYPVQNSYLRDILCIFNITGLFGLLSIITYVLDQSFRMSDKALREQTEKLEEANKKLHELDKIKSNFFTNISHEIRTPLTLILSPIESVLQGDYGETVDNKFFENIQRNAIRLLKLINNLLDFSKIEAGKMIMKIHEADIVAYIKSYIGAVHSSAESKKITLDFVSMHNSVMLWFDKDKIDKILMNLFSNALKFTAAGGAIKVILKDDDHNCYIEFSDTGVGIPADKLNSIFDRFSQADSSSTRKYEGTGIGLALAKELAEMHEGKITAVSKNIENYPQDHGTTFTVTIPKGKVHFENMEHVKFVSNEHLDESIPDHHSARIKDFTELREKNDTCKLNDIHDEKESAAPAKNKPSRSSNHFNKILIVEDNPDMREFLFFLLKDRYSVNTAVNGVDGLEKAMEIKPDLIISDVMMPLMNGYEMTKKIKEHDILKMIPVLMLTAKVEISNKIEGLEYGADDYLTKPFNSKELITRINSLLKINSLQKELIELNHDLETEVKDKCQELLRSDELKRYLPPQLVDAIIKGEKHVIFETERRRLTVFFSDIKGFTETTDSMEAEELSTLLNEYLSEMTTIAHKYCGTIDKFIGDAIMIFFGAPEATNDKDHALRCVKMAIEMQEMMKLLKKKWYNQGIEYPLSIRIGINTGTATVGNFGAKDRLSYTAIGGQVNLASRLEGLCEPDGVLISHSTWALIKDEIECTLRSKVKVKGISREILVYDVVMEQVPAIL
jgi:signal transduction histidine kinase/class 3 adenylate cyclase